MKVYQVLECSRELGLYLKSAEGLSKEAIALMVPDSIKLDEEATDASDKITAIDKKLIDIVGEHNINSQGIPSKAVVDSLEPTIKMVYDAYIKEKAEIFNSETSVVLNCVDDDLVVVANDAIAYKTVKKMYRDRSKVKKDE